VRKTADRLACEARNKRMLEFQGPAQPTPALGEALNECHKHRLMPFPRRMTVWQPRLVHGQTHSMAPQAGDMNTKRHGTYVVTSDAGDDRLSLRPCSAAARIEEP